MLYEVGLKRAIQAYMEGREVKVILPMDEDEERVIPFQKLFHDARLLVDRSPEDIIKDEKMYETFDTRKK